MAKKKGVPQDVSGKDYGPTYNPFTYGFNVPVGYQSTSHDKYVTSGTYNTETEELDLNVQGSETVKIKFPTDSFKKSDERVTAGTSTINEETQSISLSIGDEDGTKSQVEIDLSGIGETYYNKTEINEKLRWGEF